MSTKEKKKYRGRSFALAMLIIVAVCALIQVDAAYEDMMMREGKLSLQVRRMDERHLMVGFWGKEWLVNTENFYQTIEQFQDQTREALQGFAEKTQEFLAKNGVDSLKGEEDEEGQMEEIPVDFPTQTL
ncbi:hypothetical protein [Anaerovorax sp. IOR16]|uniref:hypothetical protein n=1 Tax=Anaerovorax sp. IOR16 TaxID=2773458 RepID=UPI0019D06CF9|nr:hypothetical protein [Anaerovorax sp. IOR16]